MFSTFSIDFDLFFPSRFHHIQLFWNDCPFEAIIDFHLHSAPVYNKEFELVVPPGGSNWFYESRKLINWVNWV